MSEQEDHMAEWARLNPAIYSTPMPPGVRNAFGKNIQIPSNPKNRFIDCENETTPSLNDENKQSIGKI